MVLTEVAIQSIQTGRKKRAVDFRRYATEYSGEFVPQKVRELVAELERAGFVNRGGKGSHRNFVHPKVSKPITISGAPGDDAKHYQVRAVKRAVEESKS